MSDEDDKKAQRGIDPNSTIGKVVTYPASLVTTTPEERSKRDLEFSIKLARARNAIDQKLLPASLWLQRNMPGAKLVSEADRLSNSKAPATRSPYQQQREFSNDAEKEAYLERIREAMKKAGK